MNKISRKNSIVTSASVASLLGTEETSVLHILEGLRKDYTQAVRIANVDPDSGSPLKEQAKAEINRLGFDGITALERWISEKKSQTNKVEAPAATLEPEPAAELVNEALSTDGITVFVTPGALEEEPESPAPVTVTVKMAVCRHCGLEVKAKNLGSHERDCAKNPKSTAFKRNQAEENKKAQRDAEMRRKAAQVEAEKKIEEQKSVVVEPKAEETVDQAELMAQMEREEAERKAFEARMKAEAEAQRLAEAAETAKKAQELASQQSFDDLLAEIANAYKQNEAVVEAAIEAGIAWKQEKKAIEAEVREAQDAIRKMRAAVALNKQMAESAPSLVRPIPQHLIDAVLNKGEYIAAKLALIEADPRKAAYEATIGAQKKIDGNAAKETVAAPIASRGKKVYDLASFKAEFKDRITFERRDGTILNGGALYCVSKTLMEIMESKPTTDAQLAEIGQMVAVDVLNHLGVDVESNKKLLAAIVESQIRYAKRIVGGSENK